MKTLLFSLFLLASTEAFSGEKSFECNARYVFGNRTAAITGTITSDTTLSDVTYSIDDQPEFVASLLTPAKSNAVSRFAFYREYKIADSAFTLYMPENMNNRETFTAIVGNKTKLEKLECLVEN